MYVAACYSGNFKGVQIVPAPHNVQFSWLVCSFVLAIVRVGSELEPSLFLFSNPQSEEVLEHIFVYFYLSSLSFF